MSRLLRNKVDEEDAADEVKKLDLLYAEVYPHPGEYQIVNDYPPLPYQHAELKHDCEYCGNKSGKSDRRGGCVSCGAPLPKIKKREFVTFISST